MTLQPEHVRGTACRVLMLLACFTAQLHSAEYEATALPGLERERSAERMERRDELVAAQMDYAGAFTEVVEAARKGGEDADALWARAEFLLEKTRELTSRTSNHEDLLSAILTFEETTSKPGASPPPPTLRARATWIKARALLTQGKADAAREAATGLGLIRDWCIVGPFDNERGRSFDTAFAVEQLPLDLTSHYKGKRTDVFWRKHQSRDPLGKLALSALFLPNTECLAYALCLVKSPDARDAALRTGSDDGMAAWLNGQEVARERATRTAGFDQNAYGIRLREGWNLLLIKVAQATDDWTLYARITAPDGSPLPDLEFRAPDLNEQINIQPATGQAPLPVVDRGALSYFAGQIADEQATSRAPYYMGYLLMARNVYGGGSTEVTGVLRLIAEANPNEPIYWLTLARASENRNTTIPDHEENERRRALSQARSVGKEEVTATVELARYYLESMNNITRAHEYANEALKANPLSRSAQLLLIDVYRKRGWDTPAYTRTLELTRRNPNNFSARLAEGALTRQERTLREATGAYAAAYEVNHLHAQALSELVDAQLETAGYVQAIATLHGALDIQPYDTRSAERLALLLIENGQPEKALAVAQQRLEDCPNDKPMIELKARALAEAGKAGDANAAWQHALALQPTDSNLRDYLRLREVIQPDGDASTLEALLQDYPAGDISPGTSHAYRLRELSVRLNGDGTRSETHHIIAEVIEKEGVDSLRHTRVFYNPTIETVKIHRARILRASGETGEGVVRGARYSDRGMERISFPGLAQGDAIEVRYTIERFQPNFFGDYYGHIHIFRTEAPTGQSRYEVTMPRGKALYIHRTGDAPEAEMHTDEQHGTVRRVWTMQSLKGVADETNMPPDVEISPTVQVSTFKDWDAMVKWYWHLIESQNQITPAIRSHLQKLTAGHQTDREKVAVIFGWVSSQIQNVAWSFGVHGYKPYSANTIFTRRFGDCKDKTTLINVMVRELGIEAWPVLLFATDPADRVAGRGTEDLSLPILRHFNHCISQVRIGDETFYLDGTINYRTMEGVHYTCAGASAVVVKPDGAEQVHLPKQAGKSNAWEEQLQVAIDANGHATFDGRLEATGNTALYMRAYFGRPFARNEVYRRIASQNYGPALGAQVHFQSEGLGPDRVGLTTTVRVRDYVNPQDKRIRLTLPKAWLRGTLGESGAIPADLSRYVRYSMREHDLLLPMAFRVQRSIAITWPAEWELVSGLSPKAIELPFGSCKVEYDLVGSTLTVNYLLEINDPRIPVKHYDSFRRLCTTADEIDARVFILERP